MPLSLQQKSLFFSTDTYTLEYNGIRVCKTGINKNVEGFIPFENIPTAKFFRRFFRKGAIITCMFFGVLNFFLIYGQVANPNTSSQPRDIIISILLILVPITILWFSRHEYVGFGVAGDGIVFAANKPSRKAVTDFMAQLQAAKVAYLRELYMMNADDVPPAEALRRLIWLKDMGALTSAEFDEQKQKLTRHGMTTTNIGFRK